VDHRIEVGERVAGAVSLGAGEVDVEHAVSVVVAGESAGVVRG